MRRPFFDGYGMVDSDHRNDPPPRVGRSKRVRHDHEKWSVVTRAFEPCSCTYDPDDVTVTRIHGTLRRTIHCRSCDSDIDLRTGRQT